MVRLARSDRVLDVAPVVRLGCGAAVAPIPTSPPQVRFPTSGPSFARLKSHGIKSPPEPEYSLAIITLGPTMILPGVDVISPSRAVQ